MGEATVDFVGTHIGWHHRNADLGWIAPKEKYTEVLFPVGVLQFCPPYTATWSLIWADKSWERSATEAGPVSGDNTTTSISAAKSPTPAPA